jgi:hypothetical protein
MVLGLVAALALMIVLVVIAVFLMTDTSLGTSAVAPRRLRLAPGDAGVIGLRTVAVAAHDFFSCSRF